MAQLAVAFAPALDSRRGSDARPHIEQTGIRLHYAHDEAACPTCVAQHLMARPEPSARPVTLGDPAIPPATDRAPRVVAAEHATANPPRAPPKLS
jgi:hypothetical protein